MNKYIGESLFCFRSYFGLTHSAIKKVTGINETRISSIENSKSEPTPEELQEYATMFGVPVNDFHQLAIAIERVKLKDGKVQKNDLAHAQRALKLAQELTRTVLQRYIDILEYKASSEGI